MRIALLLIAAGSMWAQTAISPGWKEFSIGPPTRNHSRFGRDGIHAEGVPLKRVLARAYGLPEHRILGPDWIATERYAIIAEATDPDDFQTLIQQELTTRFQMVARREKREVPVFVLKRIEGSETARKPAASNPVLKMPQATLADFASALADIVQRPVFDETGVDGTFDLTLGYTPGNMASLRAAVKDQLGFQLVDERRVVELVQIDRIQKLTFPKN